MFVPLVRRYPRRARRPQATGLASWVAWVANEPTRRHRPPDLSGLAVFWSADWEDWRKEPHAKIA